MSRLLAEVVTCLALGAMTVAVVVLAWRLSVVEARTPPAAQSCPGAAAQVIPYPPYRKEKR